MKNITITGLSLIMLNSYAQEFDVKYMDSNGFEWSQDLGEFTNGCEDEIGTTCRKTEDNLVVIEESNASRACLEIGGRLPTRIEYMRLSREFDPPSWSDSGVSVSSMRDTLGQRERTNGWFWTSSVDFTFISTITTPNLDGPMINYGDFQMAFQFSAAYDSHSHSGYRFNKASVRCIR